MKPAAFLFDLDGTLIESEMVWMRAIGDWLADQGHKLSIDELAPLVIGRRWTDVHASVRARFPDVVRQTAAEAAKTVRPYFNRLVTNPATLVIPGSVAFLRKVAKIAPCVIVSGSPHADVQRAAEFCGVAPLVKFVLGEEDYARGKPAPDGFLRAAELLDVDASECVVVEDSTAGVVAGRAAGMHVIGLARNPLVPQNYAGTEWLVHDLSEFDVEAVFGDEERGLKESVQVILQNSMQKVGSVVNRYRPHGSGQ